MNWTAERWAIEITRVLNAALGPEHFPVDVPLLAREYTRQRFPDDPVLDVLGADLPSFDGALYRATRRPGWKIIYNNAITSEGRINFTLAHELGRYLLHRLDHPGGFECGQQQVARWDSPYGKMENQANTFAAGLLMPLDDFRRILPAGSDADLRTLRDCAQRYRVSLIAATLRWLNYTTRRAVLVISRDGFILWSRASASAHRTRCFFKTSGSPVEVPMASLAANPRRLVGGRGELDHGAGVWLREPVRELALHAEQYDFTISLLRLDEPSSCHAEADDEAPEDTYSRFTRRRAADG